MPIKDRILIISKINSHHSVEKKEILLTEKEKLLPVF